MRKRNVELLFLVIVLLGFWLWPKTTTNKISPIQAKPTVTPAQVLGVQIGLRTKTTDCKVNDKLQDIACTPGDIITTATVDQICTPGYSKGVRNVPESEKNAVYAEYGIATHTTGEYEVDHLISLELGGSNDIANLWPEAAQPTPGFHEKDKVEDYLHQQVCNGSMKLDEAQRIIATDWTQVKVY